MSKNTPMNRPKAAQALTQKQQLHSGDKPMGIMALLYDGIPREPKAPSAKYRRLCQQLSAAWRKQIAKETRYALKNLPRPSRVEVAKICLTIETEESKFFAKEDARKRGGR